MNAIYQLVFPKVNRYVLKNSGSSAQAKDIFQEAFVACWQNIKERKITSGDVEAYLFTISKNKWIDHIRSAKFRKEVTPQDDGHLKVVDDHLPEEKEPENKQLKILNAAFGKLGESCRELLKAFYYQRKSLKTIAKEINLTPASARNQKYRCMQRLKALSLKNEGG